MLADKPNGLGGGVQYIDVVAGGAVWVSEPAGQGLDASYTTYDVATLHTLGTYSGSVTSTVVDSAAGALVLEPAGDQSGLPAGVAVHPDVVRLPHHPAGRGNRSGRGRCGRHAARPGPGRRRVRHRRRASSTSSACPDPRCRRRRAVAPRVEPQYDMETPPLGLSSCPVTKLLASEARYSTP